MAKELTIKEYIEATRDSLARLIPKGMLDVERLITSALKTISESEGLRRCTFKSVVECLGTCAQLGLIPGPTLGHAYLIPFEDKKKGVTTCQLILGYRGMLALLWRSGRLKSITCGVYHAKDSWDYTEGTKVSLTHRPFLEGDPGPMVAVYCVMRLRDGGTQVTVMRKDQVDAIRARSRASNTGPWVSDYEEMSKKTVIRRAAKLAGVSEEAMDDEGDVIEGTVMRAQTTAAMLGTVPTSAPSLPDETMEVQIPPPEVPEAVPVKKEARRMMVVGNLEEKLEASLDLVKAQKLAEEAKKGSAVASRELTEMMGPELFAVESFLEEVKGATSERLQFLKCFAEAYQGAAKERIVAAIAAKS